MPMIPPQPARAGRSCANCACFYELPHPKNPLERQGYCARQPAAVGAVRVQVPRVDKEGKPVVMRHDGRAVMDSIEDIAWTHAPMHASLVCMDGWRPIGARPGERPGEVAVRRALAALVPLIKNADASPEDARQVIERVLDVYLADEPAAANDAQGPAPSKA